MTPSEQAQRYFSDRGVHEETFRRHQIEIVLNPSHDQLVGWLGSNSHALDAAIVFPNLVPNPDDLSIGIHNHYVRCFPPPVWDGKEHKFLCTQQANYRPYILPPVWDVAYEIDQPIYVVEKQTAALLLHQNGFHPIALDGTWGAAAKKEEGEKVELHPVLAEFHWTGRPVYLCFDRDFRARQSVLWGLIRAYILFSIAGAVVRLIQWDDPPCTGLEDFVAAKAGLDLSKQREEIDTLTDTVSGLSASKAAGNWIIPQYRSLFEREIAAIAPGMAERSMLANCLHEALETTAGDLKKSWEQASKANPSKEEKKSPCIPIPEPWSEPLIYSEVLDRILSEFLNARFVVLSPEQSVVCSVHTLTTYLTEYLDDWLHFLYVTGGTKEVGKTKLLRLFYYLCCHSVLQGDPTAASIYYRLKTDIYTIIIDEVDKKEERKEAVLDLINYSTSRDTAWVSRADPEGKKVIDYPTFCPKILAGIGPLRGTSESRCITIQMMRKLPGGSRIMIKADDKVRFAEERSQLMRIAAEIGPKIAAYDIDTLKLPNDLSDREVDNWVLLFVVAEMVGGHWPKLLRTAFHKLCPPKNSDESEFYDTTELGEAIVRDIARIWIETPAQDFYGTEDLRKKLILMKDKPWPNMRRGMGISVERIGALLKGFGLKSIQHQILTERKRGYFLKSFTPLFRRHAADIWKFPPDGGGSSSDGGGSSPSDGGGSSETGEKGKNVPEGGKTCAPCAPTNQEVDNQAVSNLHRIKKESIRPDIGKTCASVVSSSYSASSGSAARAAHEKPLHTAIFPNSIPPSTPQASFCAPSHPERLLYLDIETFYPWESYSQPFTFTAGQLATRRRENKAHPWASDPRRCAMRFLTIHDTEGIFGPEPLTIDFQANPELPANVLEALSTRTLVGHNLDFDLTILRRYGIPVSSSIIDTMIASRLLGLGKEKPKFDQSTYDDLSLNEIEEIASEEENDPNPVDHDLVATVRRYTGIEMEKATTKLGASDWACQEITPEQRAYMLQDVAVLPRLWEAMKPELRGAGLEKVFAARMEFFPHLNGVKMAGVPVDGIALETDLQRVSEEKEHKAEELSVMFSDLGNAFEIPKSRKKKVRIKNEEGKTKFVPGPTHEGFHASHRNQHWIPALATRGIFIENTQEPTLRRIDKPECWALLKYASAAKRLSEIKGIARSLFSDRRVRAENWNQLSARTGRMTSTRPNLQQVPRDWRTGFRVEPPQLWLKGDLSQIEMLIIAITTGDQNMIEMIRDGKDIYVEYGARIFDKKPERGPGEDQITDQLREVAKKPTLGIFYGLTPWGFVRAVREKLDLEYSIEQAEDFFRQYFEMFPGVEAYYDVAEENAYHQETVHTVAGTRRFLPPLIGEPSDDWEQNKTFRKSWAYRRNILLNSPIQGSGADLVIWAVNQFMPQLPAGVEIVNLVHDEVDALVTKETLRPTVETITRAFQETFARFYPASTLKPKIKFSVGPSWGEVEKLS